MGASPVVLCPRCERDTVPQLKEPSWHRDVHRKAEYGAPDPRAVKIKARKDAKRVTRSTVRALGIAGAATLFLRTRAADMQPPPSDDCPKCLTIRARFLGYDPRTNRAYAEIIP